MTDHHLGVREEGGKRDLVALAKPSHGQFRYLTKLPLKAGGETWAVYERDYHTQGMATDYLFVRTVTDDEAKALYRLGMRCFRTQAENPELAA
jgi:hypothetical protein